MPHAQADGDRSQGHPRRRRWPWILLIVLVVLVALVWSIPYLLSTGPGTRWVAGLASGYIKGSVAIDRLSLRWLGDCTIQGLHLRDPQGREVAAADEVVYPQGILGAARSPYRFGDVRIRRPGATLYAQDNGGFSIVDAVSSRTPSQNTSQSLPPLDGRLQLSGGYLKVIPLQGQSYALEKVDADVTLRTLNDIKGRLAAAVQQGGRLTANMDMQNFAPQGQFDLRRVTGTVAVKTEGGQAVAIGSLAALAAPEAGLGGELLADINANFKDGQGGGVFDIRLAGFEARRLPTEKGRSLDAHLAGRADLANSVLTVRAQAAASGHGEQQQIAQLAFAGNMNFAGKAAPAAGDEDGDLVTNVLSGDFHSLPQASLEANGKADFAALAEALPRLLMIRKDTHIQSGMLMVENLAVVSGPQPSAKGKITLTDLKAQVGDRQTAWRPLVADVELVGQTGVGLRVNKADVQSSFATFTAGGTMEDMKGELAADLAAARRDLNDLFDFRLPEMTGNLRQTFHMTRPGQGAAGPQGQAKITSIATALDIQNLQMVQGKETYRSQRLHVEGKAQLQGKDLDSDFFLSASDLEARGQDNTAGSTINAELRGKARQQAGKLVAEGRLVSHIGNNAQEAANVTFTGSYAAGKKPLTAAATANQPQDTLAQLRQGSLELPDFAFTADGQADIASLAQAIPAMLALPRDVQVQGGMLKMQQVKFTGGQQPAATGAAFLTNVRLASPTGRGAWERIEVSFDVLEQHGDGLQLRTLRVLAPFASVTAGGRLEKLDGHLEADLAEAQNAVLVFGVAGPALEGRLKTDFSLATGERTQSGDTPLAVGATGGVSGLQVGQGQNAFKEQQVTFDCRGDIDNRAAAISLRNANLKAASGTVNLAGNITNYRQDVTLDLTGDYRADWGQFTRLLHQLSPATEDDISIAGTSQGNLRVTGPLSRPEILPTYKGVEGQTTVLWEKADLYGLEIGRATMQPSLDQGQLRVPMFQAPGLAGGTIRFGTDVDLTTREPLLKMPGDMQVLQDIRINKKMSQKLLSRINPLFGDIVAIDGTINLRTQDINLPLSSAILRTGSGRGHLDLQQLRIQPAGPLGQLLSLAQKLDVAQLGKMGLLNVRFEGVDFVLEKGRLSYKNLGLIFFDAYDLRFSGSVGFDGSVDLVVSVPVMPGLLSHLGIQGNLPLIAQAMKMRVDIPITGTRELPRLEMARLNTKQIAQQALATAARAGLTATIGPAAALVPEKLLNPENLLKPENLIPLPGQAGPAGATAQPGAARIPTPLDLLPGPFRPKQPARPPQTQPATP